MIPTTSNSAPQINKASSAPTPAEGKVMSPADDGHDNTTVQGGIPGPWNERLPHFRFDEIPSNGDEIQSEYFVAREDALARIRAQKPVAEKIAAADFVIDTSGPVEESARRTHEVLAAICEKLGVDPAKYPLRET